jgi:hypothetical protein
MSTPKVLHDLGCSIECVARACDNKFQTGGFSRDHCARADSGNNNTDGCPLGSFLQGFPDHEFSGVLQSSLSGVNLVSPNNVIPSRSVLILLKSSKSRDARAIHQVSLVE